MDVTEPVKTNRLVGSRQTEELIAETWHHLPGFYTYNREALNWLESDAMVSRWCMPASAVGKSGLYFESEEDKMQFWIIWHDH
jgi:hypothetical protein